MKRYKGDPYWLTCRYPGKCANCDEVIPRGARAFYYPKGRYLYCKRNGCGDTAEADFNAHAFDEAVYNGQW